MASGKPLAECEDDHVRCHGGQPYSTGLRVPASSPSATVPTIDRARIPTPPGDRLGDGDDPGQPSGGRTRHHGGDPVFYRLIGYRGTANAIAVTRGDAGLGRGVPRSPMIVGSSGGKANPPTVATVDPIAGTMNMRPE